MHWCAVCGKSFLTPYKLRRHQVVHTGQKPYVCEICGKAFTQPVHLKTHLLNVHTSQNPRGSGNLANDRKKPNLDKPATGVGTLDNCAITPEWKRGTVTQKSCRPLSQTGNRRTNVAYADDGSVTMDASSRRSRKGFTCKICLKCFSSSLQLWIHSPIHKSTEKGQTSSAKINLKKCLPRRDLKSSCKSKIGPKHHCRECFKTFGSPYHLQRHFQTHTGQKPYSCTVCQKAFTQKPHLKTHLANRCPLSGLNAESRHERSLQDPSSHLNSSVELKLQCQPSVNKTEMKLDAVVKPAQEFTKKDMKPFQCMSCNRSFRLEVNLIHHCKIHQNSEESGHSVQNRTMTNSHDLKICDSEVPEGSHADHTDSSIFVEPESWRELWDASSSQDALSTKRQSSTSDQINTSHECYMCSKCFPSGSKLQRHMMTHTGHRPFHCDICGKRFQQETHLRVHSRTHLWSRYQKQRSLYISRPPSHTGGFNDVPNNKMLVPKQEIETCTAAVITQNNSKRESRNKLFPRTFNQNETLHIRKVSTVKVKGTQMAKSMQNPGNARHKCFHCFKCFQSASKLQRHEMVHTGLKPFPCPKCGRAFGQTSHLKRHERTRCPGKLSKPVNRQVNIKKLKTSCQQQQLYSRITVSVPTPQQPANTSAMSSACSLKTNTKSKTKKLHTCRICSKNFTSSYKLSRHVVTHSGLRPFKCALCSKTFAQRCHLKVHEHRCRQEGRTSHYTRSKVIKNITHPQNKCLDNLTDNPDFSLRAVRQQSVSKSKAKKLHTCRICSKNFTSSYKLSRHFMTHSGLRPFKCALCSKTFTQRCHLKVHEHRCRQGSRTSHYTRSRVIKNITHPQNKCVDNLTDNPDFSVRAVRQQSESCYSGVGDVSCITEAVDTTWLSIPEVGFKEDIESVSLNDTAIGYDQATDQCSYSFPSEPAPEMDNLIQNQAIAGAPMLYQHNMHNVEIPCRYESITAVSDKNNVLSHDRCEPLMVFECGKCAVSFTSKRDLKKHLCPAPKLTTSAPKNQCDVCFKHFVSPSKLHRHYIVHTGQRPFKCGICGKTFTQTSHARKHSLTHIQ